MIRATFAAALATMLFAAPFAAAQQAAKPKERSGNSPLGNLGNSSKEPIKIDADRLDVFDRDNKAVFSGNVVAVQGDTTIRCVTLTVLYERGGGASQGSAPAVKGAAAANPGENAIRQIDCAGKPPAEPVTVVSKDQVAVGDHATFDRIANKVVLTGNVALSQCQNVTRGEKLVYDLNTGIANMETAPGGRVKALFVPGGKKEGEQQAQGCQTGQPAAAATQAAQAKPAAPAAAPTQAAQAKPKPPARAN